LTVSLPWIVDEVEETRRLFGRQIWDYSIEGSLPTLNALLTYLDEQKLSQRRMSVDELFVANISPGLADYSAQLERRERVRTAVTRPRALASPSGPLL
jgi:hypothetical protein